MVAVPEPGGCDEGFCRAPPPVERPAEAFARAAGPSMPEAPPRPGMRLVKTVRLVFAPTAGQAEIPGFREMLELPVEEMVWWLENNGVPYELTETRPQREPGPKPPVQLGFSFRDGTEP
jgi:hypothetical protein